MKPALHSRPAERLFDDFERTYEGRGDLGEAFYSFFDRSALPGAAEVRDRCNDWFENYSKNATQDDLNDFRSRFRSKKSEQYHAAWFELCAHEILARLGFSVSMHPKLPGTDKRPDFAVTSNGSRILVEATVVRPDSGPDALSPFERDAEYKMSRLKLGNFWASITRFEGSLDRLLTRKEIDRAFRTFFDKHDPDNVQRLLDTHGDRARPTERIRFGNWQLTVELFPAGPASRAPSEGRVQPWSPGDSVEPSVHHIQAKIKKKSRVYGPTGEPLILAVNVHAREYSPIEQAKEALFGNNGIWHQRRLRRSTVSGVVVFWYADAVSAPSTSACLFVNPSVALDALPPVLLRLPRAQGPDGSERIEGESVATILGLD